MTHKTQVSLKIPNVEDLCCINCKIIPSDKQDSIIKSTFHNQILTCRLIIYSARCCVASPSIQNVGDSIHVIVNRRFFATGKLQEHLKELNIKFSEPEEVHPKIYEACLKYTFTFKIAPHWNFIGTSLYLRGSNFLPFPSAVDAIDWIVHYKDDDTKLELKPMKLNIRTLTLEFLKIPPSILDNFISNPNCSIDTINLTLFPCPWVYVLPKLTRARLLSVSKILPQNCPFDSYNDLRRHWKNMYSYRLPKTSDGMLFYEVVFPSYPHEPYIYPEACLLSKTPEFLTCEDKSEIALGFLKDLAQNVHSVCGEPIHVSKIYPTLSVEYSCSVKKQRSTEVCTEYQEILNRYNSPFFKNPSECIIIPADTKPNLSSMIAFNGMDKMKTPMRNHTRNILSIMDKSKPKRKQAAKKSQYVLGTQKSSQDIFTLPETEKPTVVHNINEVLSFYDIPSMHQEKISENSENKNEKNITEVDLNTHDEFSATQLQAPYFNQPSHCKPVVKSIQNVNYDISAFKQMKTKYEQNKQNDTMKNVKNDKVKQSTVNNSLKTPSSAAYTPNSFEKIKETFYPTKTSTPRYQGFRKFDFQNDIEPYNIFQSQELKSNSQENSREPLGVNNDDLRKKLANFDEYHSVGKKNKNKDPFRTKIEKEQKSSSLRSENCSEKSLRLDNEHKTSQHSKFSQLQEEFNSPKQFSSLPSTLEYKRTFKLQNVDLAKLKEFIKQQNSPEPIEPNKSDSDEEERLQCSPSLLEAVSRYFNSPESNKELDSIKTYSNHELEEKISQKRGSKESQYTSRNLEDEISQKRESKKIEHTSRNMEEEISQRSESKEVEQILRNFDSNEIENISYIMSPISSQNTDMFERSANRKLLQTCESPISIYNQHQFKENNFNKYLETDKENVFNSQQHSPIFEKHESQKKISQISERIKSVKSMENPLSSSAMDVDNSDFYSILSQSSNESGSEKYESYKQACTEALTFN